MKERKEGTLYYSPVLSSLSLQWWWPGLITIAATIAVVVL
jgi:hypothetical protein